jgi:hypothetical protein
VASGENFLIGFGDCLGEGTYRQHSQFRRVVNYIANDNFLSLVTPDVGNGPFHIVFPSLDSLKSQRITLAGSMLFVDGVRFRLLKDKKYDSTISYSPIDYDRYRENCSSLTQTVLQQAPPKSYAFLLEESRKEQFTSAFEKTLVGRVSAGLKELVSGNYARGANLIRGTGYGLTPSGDDFIAGYLVGLTLLGHIIGLEIASVQKIIWRESKSDNIFSNMIIKNAMRGFYMEKIKKLLLSLLYGRSNDVKACAVDVLSLGDTSGADYTTGLLAALKGKKVYG